MPLTIQNIIANNARGFFYGDSVSYLVDDYSPVAAYSVDKISSTSTVCCRVRRESDNAEQDIGFSGNLMDVASVEAFVGTNNQAYLVKVYNQGTGGSTYDITQSVVSLQGRVAYAASPVYFLMQDSAFNWKPPFDIANNLTFTNLFAVAEVRTRNTVDMICGNPSPYVGLFYGGSAAGYTGLGGRDGTNVRMITGEDLNEHLGYFNMKSSKLYIAKDGTTETDAGTFATSMLINEIGGNTISTGAYLKGTWKEMIFFNSDETANKTAIETNINDRFSIY